MRERPLDEAKQAVVLVETIMPHNLSFDLSANWLCLVAVNPVALLALNLRQSLLCGECL